MDEKWFQVGAEGTRRAMASVGGPMRLLVANGDSNGLVTIVEQRMDGPGGPPLHVHFAMDEWMMVIDGGPLTVQVGAERRELARGESIWMPRGTPHTFSNLSGSPVRVLACTTPGGVEDQLHRQAEYFLGLAPGQRPDPAAIAAIWEGNAKVVGPPIS
jgi:mannose-6-phosphate isomerase-like protein (cupin superfamily)